jgi:hypothetical protein
VSSSIQLYKFTDPSSPVPANCWTPEYTRVHSDPTGIRPFFVNTGRRAFRVWGFAFDPREGKVAFQKRTATCTASAPTY